MLHFEGSHDLPQPLALVAGKLTDLRFLVQCVPGVESVTEAAADSARCVLRPGFSFVRGTLELTLRLLEVVPETSARLSIQGQGIGTTSNIEVGLTFQAHDSGSRVPWRVDIKELGGLLKAVPPGLVQAAAQKVIADAWSSVETKLKA